MVVSCRLVGTADSLVPIETEGAVFSIDQATFIGAGTASFGMSIPEVGCLAPLDGVTLATEAYWACGERRSFGGAGGLPKPMGGFVFGRYRPGGSRTSRGSVKLPCPTPIPIAVVSLSCLLSGDCGHLVLGSGAMRGYRGGWALHGVEVR